MLADWNTSSSPPNMMSLLLFVATVASVQPGLAVTDSWLSLCNHNVILTAGPLLGLLSADCVFRLTKTF